jgi:hypothetical protein
LRSKNPNRVSLLLLVAIVSLGAAWIVFSKYAVPSLIESAYRGDSWPVFNRLISGHGSHSLSEYLSSWTKLQWRLLLEFSLLGLLVLAVVRPEFREAFTGTALESGKTRGSFASSHVWILLTLFAAYPLLCISLARKTHLRDILLFDPHDLRVYFNSAGWVAGQGKLYLDVRSEYPILANLIFGFVRWLSPKMRILNGEFRNFSLLWMAFAAAALLCLLVCLPKRNVVWRSWLIVLLLAPATVYFSLLRYDIYPAVFCFFGLDCIRRGKWKLGAVLLGFCVALKGYALVLVPALFVFCFFQIGMTEALVVVLIALLPLLTSQLAVFIWGGQEALLAPYKLQVFRGFNGESSFDSLFFLVSRLGVSQPSITKLSTWLLKAHIPKMLQSAVGLGVCLFRPSRFEHFVDAAFLVVLGFITFSPFYSPQYVLWLIPFLFFTADQILLFLGILLAWSSYLYFPVSYQLRSIHPVFFSLTLFAVAAIRFSMMVRLVQKRGLSEDSCRLPLQGFFERLQSLRLKNGRTNA